MTGVCPKKGQQELALRLLPGTKHLVFGKRGGLAEIMYAGTGFLHVRREVYERIQYEVDLPVCNERFPRPLIPFFQPLIYEDGEGPWYLGEDWSFSQRARQCGFCIMADTSIRLWHIGHYRYGWEDAGDRLERYSDFTLNFPKARSNGDAEPARRDLDSSKSPAPLAQLAASGIARLAASFLWPAERPTATGGVTNLDFPEAAKILVRRATGNLTRMVVDFGAALGQSTRFLADEAPMAFIIAVDRWTSDVRDLRQTTVSTTGRVALHDFLSNCWEHRDRVVPMQMTIGEALQRLAEHGVVPDLIYLHGEENSEALGTHLEGVLRLFPRATVVGDAYSHPSVRAEVGRVASNYGLRIETSGPVWRLHGLATGHVVIV